MGRPKNAGLPWTEELKTQVASKFTGGVSISDIAKVFERSTGSIRSELERQGLVEPEENDEQR